MTNSRLDNTLRYCKTDRIRPPAYSESARNHYRLASARHRKLYPEREKARQKAKYYLPAGICAICDTTEDVQRHHPDYSKPLYVIYLCRRHHRRLHRKLAKSSRRICKS